MTHGTIDTIDKPTTVDLPATLEADGAAALIARMNKLPQATEVSLNAAAVSAVSPGYMQILVSAFKTFPQLGVCNASAEFADAFAAYGINYPEAVAPVAAPESRSSKPFATSDRMAEPMSVHEPDCEIAAATEVAPDRTPAAVAKTILTIDDSRTMRDMLNMALSGAGFTVVQAVDGQHGLSVLAQHPIDLIITDINMPKLDGYGVIRAVRKDPTYNNTPILVLSTEAEQESKDIAKNAGATGWIVKPFDPAGLVNIVNSVCG